MALNVALTTVAHLLFNGSALLAKPLMRISFHRLKEEMFELFSDTQLFLIDRGGDHCRGSFYLELP